MLELDELAQQARKVRRTLDKRQAQSDLMKADAKKLRSEIGHLKLEIELYEKVTGVLTKIGEERQNSAQEQIEALVTQGLRTIFGEELSFHVVQGIRGKSPVVDFIVRSTYKDGRLIETPVMEARGGGLSSVVGFLLRLVILLLSLDKQESLLVLDETFSHVSEEYGSNLAEFIREIVDKTGVQVLLVTHTHVDEFLEIADKAYKFSLDKNGYTHVVEL